MATGETKLSYLDVVDDIQDGDTVPILRDGKNYMSTGLAQLNADLTDIMDIIPSEGAIKAYIFNTSDTIQNQIINDLPIGSWIFGRISSAGSGTSLGLPINSGNFVLIVSKWSATYANVLAMQLGSGNFIYSIGLNGGTWGNWYRISTSEVSTSSVGDPVVMEDEDSVED